MTKRFRLEADEIKELVSQKGWCIASDRITVDGCRVGFMYRETPTDDGDSGWRFFAGDESDDYVDDPAHLAMYEVNTIANYDPVIISWLDSSFMSAFERATELDDFTQVRFPEAGLN